MQFEDKHYAEKGCRSCQEARKCKSEQPIRPTCKFCAHRECLRISAERKERMQRKDKKRRWVNEINQAGDNFFYDLCNPYEDTVHRILIHTLDHVKRARKAEEEYHATDEEIAMEYGPLHREALKYLELIEDIVQLTKPIPKLVRCHICPDMTYNEDGYCLECKPIR